MAEHEKLTLNKETVDILVANIIPTAKYFETRFDFMQHQITQIKEDIDQFKKDVDRRFVEVKEDIYQFKKDVDRRFEEVDKRFEQVDKHFEQVESRLSKIEDAIVNLTLKIEELSKKQEVTIRDYIIKRDRYYDKKFAQLRNFNIAIITLIAGLLLKAIGVLDRIF